jgi:prophage antirepressor-like protein
MLKELYGPGPYNSEPETSVIKLGVDTTNIGYHDGKAIYISEPGLYSLIMKSKVKFAETFQDFVFEEILPSIRKFGSYKICKQLEESEEKLKQKELESEEKLKLQEIKLKKESEEKLKKELKLQEQELIETKKLNDILKRRSNIPPNILIPRTKTEIIYIATCKHDARQNMFKIGGTKNIDSKSGRLISYNTGRHDIDMRIYYCDTFYVHNFRDIEARIKSILSVYRPEKDKEIYNMHYSDLKKYVSLICNNSISEIDILNKEMDQIGDNLYNKDPEIPEPEPKPIIKRPKIIIKKPEPIITQKPEPKINKKPKVTIEIHIPEYIKSNINAKNRHVTIIYNKSVDVVGPSEDMYLKGNDICNLFDVKDTGTVSKMLKKVKSISLKELKAKYNIACLYNEKPQSRYISIFDVRDFLFKLRSRKAKLVLKDFDTRILFE